MFIKSAVTTIFTILTIFLYLYYSGINIKKEKNYKNDQNIIFETKKTHSNDNFLQPEKPMNPYDNRAFGYISKFMPVQTFDHPFDVIDGHSFRSGKLFVVLYGIESVPWSAVCQDKDGARWACGLQARAALHNLLKQKKIWCMAPFNFINEMNKKSEYKKLQCFIGTQNIAVEQVQAGWARPLNGLDKSFSIPHLEAKSYQRGLWNGEWTVVSSSKN